MLTSSTAFEPFGDRHDNDKKYISQIAIIPTENEIRSKCPEYLPSPLHFEKDCVQDVECLFDTYFRLHRYDIFAEVKHVIRDLLEYSLEDSSQSDNTKLSRLPHKYRTFVYTGAVVTSLRSTKMHGIETQIRFHTPPNLQQKTVCQRQQWWDTTKRLEQGTLLCLILFQDGKSVPIFFTVSGRSTDIRNEINLVANHRPAISGKFVSTIAAQQLVTLAASCRKANGLLVEFPRVVPATFMPVLENLQQMITSSCSTLVNWILGSGLGNSSSLMPPPAYARVPRFTFDLSPIAIDPTVSLSFKPGVNTASMHRKLMQSTTLDEGQCEALLAGLSREFALIQGPPGTGKSYVGTQLVRVLLANKVKANLGPIIVVCHTNHALDQFLEHLLAAGIESIIRIGRNGSSPLLESKNLRNIPRHGCRSASEARALGQAFETKAFSEDILLKHSETLFRLQRPTWCSLRDHLRWKYRDIHQQFLFSEENRTQTEIELAPFDLWLAGHDESSMEIKQECIPYRLETILSRAAQNIYTLSLEDRVTLVSHWKDEIMDDIVHNISSSLREIESSQATVNLVHDEINQRVLGTTDIIGLTTTGLSKYASVLRSIDAKVVLCEEAAEILEAHILATFMPNIQHLILIGDHKQLRPRITNCTLFSLESTQGKRYQLDRSLFERLAEPATGESHVPVTQLNVQRRMRPEISRLIRDTLYPKLTDHPNTKSLPNVLGMRKNVFWYHHTKSEECDQPSAEGKSHSNNFEVHTTSALVRHLVNQGAYKLNEIVILTPYASQLRKLQMQLSKSFEVIIGRGDQAELGRTQIETTSSHSWKDFMKHQKRDVQHNISDKSKQLLRIATVDNFQGDEAKIVIISLVRSNKCKNVGFLGTTNRINVLLSRAKHGMYLIGNADTYAHIPMWSRTLSILRETNAVGSALSLCRPRQKDMNMLESRPEDLEIEGREGGCTEKCDR